MLFACAQLSAQSPQIIKTLSFQKNQVNDSLQAGTNVYKIFVVIELQDTVSFSQIECNLSTIDSTASVYINKQFSRTTPGLFVDGSSYTKDGNFLYVCLGSYVLNKPILVETILKNNTDQVVGRLAIKE